jgi:multicomponent Na+:H+ antiporter subunit B
MTRLALVVATVLIVGFALSLVVFSLPEFGSVTAPTRNEAVREYIEDSLEETGAPSSITAIVFDYRGYDTFGEATVLFTAGAAAAAVLVRSRRD